MALETGDHIADLIATNPLNTDPKSQGAGHLRLIKAVIKTTLPNFNEPLTVGPTQINFLENLDENVKAGLVGIRDDIDALGTMADRDVTLSTSDPSGGADGDVWFKYE